MTKTTIDAADRPNLAEGVAVGALQPGGMVLGRVGDEDVLLARTGDELFAVGAHCTHYHGALVDGLRRWRHGTVPVTPRLFQPADRRAASGAGAGSDRVLESGAPG